jgi:hypothetical protein
MEVNKIILMEAIENLVDFDGLCQITGFGISVDGTIVDYIMIDDYGEIKFFAGDDPTYEYSEWEELILTAEEQNRVLKEFNELV